VKKIGRQQLSGRKQGGAAVIEFALVLPILLFIAVGIIYYGYVFMLDAAVTHAAKQGAQVAAYVDPVGLDGTEYQDAVTAQVNTSVTNSLSWLPNSVLDNLGAEPVNVSFSGPAAGIPGGIVIITVTMNVSGGTSPLLPQINLPGFGAVPPLPLTLNGVAQVVL